MLPIVYPALPPLVADFALDEATALRIRRVLEAAGCHSPNNQSSPEGVMKWGHRFRFTVSEIRVSRAPFPGLAPESSQAEDDDDLHLALGDGQELYGHRTCRSITEPLAVNGVALRDKRGRTWFCRSEDQETPSILDRGAGFDGTGRLTRLPAGTAPILKLLHLPEGKEIADMDPFGGRLVFHGHDLTGVLNGPLREITPSDTHLARGLDVLKGRVDAILAREDRIIAAVEDILTPEALAEVFAAAGLPLEDGFFPSIHSKGRRDFENALHDLSFRMAKSLREAGLCAPCPNEGAHRVMGITPWNLFLEGKLDASRDELRQSDLFYHKIDLDRAPFFRMMASEVLNACMNAKDRILSEEGRPSRDKLVVTADMLEKALPGMIADIMEALHTESDRFLFFTEMRSNLQEHLRFHLAGSFLTPVLATIDHKTGIKTPLPVDPEPKVARHLEMSMPSGRLLICDWPRIPGFLETVQALCEGDNYEISYVSGRDACMRDYYERLGLGWVHTGGSPSAYADGPGAWRIGHVDENLAGAALSQPSWQVSTVVRANTFADVEVVADILMASGQYKDRRRALAAIDRYAADPMNDAHVIDMGPGALHLYVPTGYGNRGGFTQRFRAEEFDYPEWRQDRYVMSRSPLTVDPDLLEDHGWREGRVDAALRPRAEEDEPEADEAPEGP